MKQNFLIVILISMILISFVSCTNIYLKGVDYEDFPEKDIPIYDDAVVYEFEQDDEEMELSCGTADDIDDIIEFYLDEFDDEDYIIVKEKEDKDEYKVEGYIDDIHFEIEAEEADGEEEEYFDTVINIKITLDEKFEGEKKQDVKDESATENFEAKGLASGELGEGFYIKRNDSFFECGMDNELYESWHSAYLVPLERMPEGGVAELKTGETLVLKESYLPEYIYITPIVLSGYTMSGYMQIREEGLFLSTIYGSPNYLGVSDLYKRVLRNTAPFSIFGPIEKINDGDIDTSSSRFLKIDSDEWLISCLENEEVKFSYYSGTEYKSFSAIADLCYFFHKYVDYDGVDSMDGYISQDVDHVVRAEYTKTQDGYVTVDYVFETPGLYFIRARDMYNMLHTTTIINIID